MGDMGMRKMTAWLCWGWGWEPTGTRWGKELPTLALPLFPHLGTGKIMPCLRTGLGFGAVAGLSLAAQKDLVCFMKEIMKSVFLSLHLNVFP